LNHDLKLAEQVGDDSQFYFSRAFKRIIGVALRDNRR